MSTKTEKTKRPASAPRYAPEDLEPRDRAADEAALDKFVERNRDTLNASIERAQAEFDRGEYFSLDQAIADVQAQRQRRRSDKT